MLPFRDTELRSSVGSLTPMSHSGRRTARRRLAAYPAVNSPMIAVSTTNACASAAGSPAGRSLLDRGGPGVPDLCQPDRSSGLCACATRSPGGPVDRVVSHCQQPVTQAAARSAGPEPRPHRSVGTRVGIWTRSDQSVTSGALLPAVTDPPTAGSGEATGTSACMRLLSAAGLTCRPAPVWWGRSPRPRRAG